MNTTEYLTVQSQFEMDARDHASLEETKKTHEEEPQQELYARMGNTLADFQTWPSWIVEDAETPDNHVYKLTMKVVFKP